MVIAPARRAGDPGSIPGPGENFSLKLLIHNKHLLLLKFPFIMVFKIITIRKIIKYLNLFFIYINKNA